MKNSYLFLQVSVFTVLIFLLHNKELKQDATLYGYVPLVSARDAVKNSQIDSVSIQVFWLSYTQLQQCRNGIVPVLSVNSSHSFILLNREDILNLEDLILSIKIVPHVVSENPYMKLVPEKMILISSESINIEQEETKGFFLLDALEYEFEEDFKIYQQDRKSRPRPSGRGLFCLLVWFSGQSYIWYSRFRI